jgi:alkylation response protein AidB-like acyl-CoA dehydrogenase
MNFDLTPEQKMWQATVHDFVEKEVKLKAREVDEKAQFNWTAVRKMGPLGLLGLNVSEAYGGADVDAVSTAVALEELGWGCGSTALSIAAHNGLGCALISTYGTPAQKQKYLPKVVDGKGKLAAFAITEPGAGSDIKGGIRTRADFRGDVWVINGSKMWCTNASIAEFILVLAQTNASSGSKSLSIFIVPTESKGLHIGSPEKKMGLNGSPTNALNFEEVQVSGENLLGEIGSGLRQTLHILDGGRIGIGAISVGIARAALEESIRYSKERQTFGKPIADYQAIQWMLADGRTEIEAARLLVRYAAWLKENDRSYSTEAAMAKLYSTEMAERVTRSAIQIHGGYGYSREYPVELMYRDARLMTIGEGTSEVQRMVIARKLVQADDIRI